MQLNLYKKFYVNKKEVLIFFKEKWISIESDNLKKKVFKILIGDEKLLRWFVIKSDNCKIIYFQL